jgi:elongation factor Ts
MSEQITPAMIKELRDRTGVGMGKCKEALEGSHGDMEAAIAYLRKAGIASAVKKEGRAANEGMIGIGESPKAIALVEVNAETDFVVRNERFQQFLRDIAEEIAKTTPTSLEDFKQQKFSKDPHLTIEEHRATIVQAIGENIQIRRFILLPKSSDKSLGIYSHHGGKLVTMVELAGSSSQEALARDIAMHSAAAAPEYLSEKQVPESVIAHEREIAQNQIQGKPENIVQKIVDGKIQAFFDTHCLLRQKYVKNDSLAISDLVKQHAKELGQPLEIVRFLRWAVGQQ